MKIGQILVEIEEIGLEVDEVVSLLSVFEKWFDASFKVNEVERVHNEAKNYDLWMESPDYATVFDIATEKLFSLREALKELDKERAV